MSAPINDGGPAFPVDHKFVRQTASLAELKIACGMTLRDYFAGQALAAFIAAPMGKYAHQSTLVHIATDSYDSADAMLATRERKGGAA